MLVSDFHVVLKIAIDVPPGLPREQAAKMLSQTGVNVSLGLLQYVRRADCEIVEGPVPTETGGGPRLI